MEVPSIVTMDMGQAMERCAQLSQSGWESAQLAASALEQSPGATVETTRIKTASMAGIYSTRLAQNADLPQRTLDIGRFVQSLRESTESFVRFFSVRFKMWRILVVLSDDMRLPIAATAVSGVGENPAGNNVGAVGTISASEALALCRELMEDGWGAASIAVEKLAASGMDEYPVWIASPVTLARHYRERATVTDVDSRNLTSLDLDRFSQVMSGLDDATVRIFHLFDDYGWQATCAVSNDFAHPLGAVAIRRSRE
ncbi:hypothetical protein ACFY3M_47135 [Streptomyces mirabilis]|uniref:hypothetical protein n=1 Tax=Streptomyces mirabilis TaxID=68239 RepID=UPI00368D12EA